MSENEEMRAAYGTVDEVHITISDEVGSRTIKLPNPADDIESDAQTLANLILDADSNVLVASSGQPTKVVIDIVSTTRTNVYTNE